MFIYRVWETFYLRNFWTHNYGHYIKLCLHLFYDILLGSYMNLIVVLRRIIVYCLSSSTIPSKLLLIYCPITSHSSTLASPKALLRSNTTILLISVNYKYISPGIKLSFVS